MNALNPLVLLALVSLTACGRAAPGTAADSEADAAADLGPEIEDDAETDAPDAAPDAPDAETAAPDHCDPATQVCRITLETGTDGAGGVDLATGERTVLATDGSANDGPDGPVDLSARLGRFLGLTGAALDSLCTVGGTFGTLDAVPADDPECMWSRNALYGVLTNPFDRSAAIGQGLLVRARRGDRVYKARIVDDDVGYEDVGGYTGWITFDYTLVRP